MKGGRRHGNGFPSISLVQWWRDVLFIFQSAFNGRPIGVKRREKGVQMTCLLLGIKKSYKFSLLRPFLVWCGCHPLDCNMQLHSAAYKIALCSNISSVWHPSLLVFSRKFLWNFFKKSLLVISLTHFTETDLQRIGPCWLWLFELNSIKWAQIYWKSMIADVRYLRNKEKENGCCRSTSMIDPPLHTSQHTRHVTTSTWSIHTIMIDYKLFGTGTGTGRDRPPNINITWQTIRQNQPAF